MGGPEDFGLAPFYVGPGAAGGGRPGNSIEKEANVL